MVCALDVCIREKSALQKADAHGREIIRSDIAIPDRRACAESQLLSLAFDAETHGNSVGDEGNSRYLRSRLYARKRLNASEDVFRGEGAGREVFLRIGIADGLAEVDRKSTRLNS